MDYSYIRETFNKDLFSNYVLSICLDADGFSFYIADKESLNLPLYFSFKKFEKSGIDNLVLELKKFQEFDNNLFHKSVITYHTRKFCLIPAEHHDPDHLEDYFQLSHPFSEEEDLLFSEIQVNNCKVLYSIQIDLHTLLKNKFHESTIIHTACPAINYGINKPGKTCLINLYQTSLSIAIFDFNELKLYNVCSIQDENDIVYHIFNSLKSFNQEVSSTVFYLSGMKNDNTDRNILLLRYISNPVFYQPDLLGVTLSEFPSNILFNHLESLNCVS